MRLDDASTETALAADSDLNLNLTFGMTNGTINANLYEIHFNNFTVTNSNIGPINDKSITEKLNGFINSLIPLFQNKIVDVLSKLKIPTILGLNFNQTDLSPQEGYVKIGIFPHLSVNYTLARILIDYVGIDNIVDYLDEVEIMDSLFDITKF